jgi:flagellar basal body-associated protein FliL
VKKYLAILAIVCLVILVSAAGVFIGTLFSDKSTGTNNTLDKSALQPDDLPNLSD